MMIIGGMHSQVNSSVNPLPLNKIILPFGFKIEVYAQGVEDARALDFADDSTLFVGTGKAGRIYAVRPDRKVIVLAEGLDRPAGLDFYEGDLYVAEVTRIIRYENVLDSLGQSPQAVVINANLPADTMHAAKFLRVGYDGKIYFAVNANCNACMISDNWHGRILRVSADGSLLEYYSEGVRDVGGFDWSPWDRVMWFTENGRASRNEGPAPDELNKASVAGMHFGFPFMAGKDNDPQYWILRPKGRLFTTPTQLFAPRSSPSGMRFYDGEMFGSKYKGGIFVAENGAGDKSGYRVSFVQMDSGQAVGILAFASGWLQNGVPWGRPADVQPGPDGALYVSDSMAGVIYRIYRSSAK